MERIAKVVGGRFGAESRPEDIHDAFAVETVLWYQGEQLYEAGRFLESPLVFLYDARSCPDSQSPE